MDYKPIGHTANIVMHPIEVEGKYLYKTPDLDTKLVSVIDGYTIILVNGKDLRTNTEQSLQFSIEKDSILLEGKDMQSYLGANAHIVMINKTDKDFLHIHPMSDNRFPIYAETYIKKAGLYRMWVQFKIDGKLHTTDFTVLVSESDEMEGSHNNHGAHH
jgi:hypothetical protein